MDDMMDGCHCVIIANKSMASHNILLWVATCLSIAAARSVEELPTLKQEYSEVLYKLNQPFKLECGVVGEPKQNIEYQWLKDGSPVVLNSKIVVPEDRKNTLVFLDPSKETEGVYLCYAKTNLGVASSGLFNVKRTYIDVPEVQVQKHTPVEGEMYQLDCPQVNAYPKPETTWYLQLADAPIVSNTILNRRITAAPNGNLYFAYIDKEDVDDDFKYVCVATHPSLDKPVTLAEHVIEGMQNNDGSLKPLAPQFLSKDMTAFEGDVTLIYCIYGGSPLAHPDWFFEDTNVNGNPKDRITRHNRSSGKRLLIKDTRLTDTGRFLCKVSQEDGAVQTHEMRLNVVSPPKFVKKPESVTSAKEGQDIIIPCQVRSQPTSTVSWNLNTKTLKPDERTSFADTGVQIHDLVLKSVKKSDSGYYGCKIVNDHGTAYTETLLYVV